MSLSPLPTELAIDVRRLSALREVARTGSISDAADALYFTASAVSQQIRRLEQELGVTLLDRGPSSISLNDAGRTLVDHAEFILEELENAEEHLKKIASLNEGRLRLATFRTAGESFVAEAVTHFATRYPQVELKLREGEPEQYLSLLKKNELDLALAFEYDHIPLTTTRGIERVELFEEPMLVAIPVNHRLTGHDDIDLTLLADETWISSTPRSAVHAFTTCACEAAGFTPRIRYETDDYHVAKAFVARGLGVAFVPAISATVPSDGITFRRVAGNQPKRRIFAAHRPDGERLLTVAAMLEILTDVTCDLPLAGAPPTTS